MTDSAVPPQMCAASAAGPLTRLLTSGSSTVRQRAVLMLRQLCYDESSLEAIAAAGGATALVALLGVRELREAAVGTLSAIAPLCPRLTMPSASIALVAVATRIERASYRE